MTLGAFATIRPKPDHFADARAAIEAILPATRAEAGCIAFTLHEGVDGDTLHLYELWADRAAFEAHHAQDYTAEVYRRYADWLAAPVSLAFFRPVA